MKKSKLERSFALAKMAIQVGFKEITSGKAKSRIDQATIITKSLAELKGAAMKVGQLLSMEVSDYFPPEAVQILSQLQSQAPAHKIESIYQVLETEFGRDWQKIFKDFSTTPIAAASIGQVHTALIDNQLAAVKIQYPGIATSVDSDLRIVRRLIESMMTFSTREFELDPIFEEARHILHQEVDYLNEAQNLTKIRSLLESSNAFKNTIIVPEPLSAATTARVLSMKFEKGELIRDWVRGLPASEDKQLIGDLILRFFCTEFFTWGFVQTDPNFGNFMVREEKDLKLVLIDYGACRNFDNDFINAYRKTLVGLKQSNKGTMIESAIENKLLDARESIEARDAFYELIRLSINPLLTNNIFDFSDDNFQKQQEVLGRNLAKSLRYSTPPRQIIFLHRKLGGVYSLLRMLKCKTNFQPYLEEFNILQ